MTLSPVSAPRLTPADHLQAGDIAVIGMSALFAKAASLQEYWQNICDGVDGVTTASPDWIRTAYDPTSTANNRLYTQKGGFLHDLAQFEPTEFGIMPRAVDGGGPDQYLAIKLVRQALADAGYGDRPLKPFQQDRTGVILGYGSYMNRGFANLLQHGLIVDQTLEILQQIAPDLDATTLDLVRRGLQDSLPPFTAEMCPGLVPNNVSGRVANRLDLMGPNYVVDAACASSLISVHLGMEELIRRRCDLAIVGGINASTPAPISMIFNQLGALTRDQIRPFDAAASGTLLGEGLGVLVLKRLTDAETDGDRIYAVLKGVGCASDGKALSSVAPRLEGETLAMRRAYDDTGLDPSTIGLVEAHGTSIPLGDRTEIASLTSVFGEREGPLPRCAIGSVKSMVAHCTTAAGAAGLIKTILALHHKVLPPTLCDRVNPELKLETTPFYINTQTRPWIHGHREVPRRAAVNAFGFGGINAHAILEEYRGSQPESLPLLPQRWASELIALAAPSRAALIDRLSELLASLDRASPTLADVAYTLSQSLDGSCRLALVATGVEDLRQKLTTAVEKLTTSSQAQFKTRHGLMYSEAPQGGKTVFLFPGEGAQYVDMLRDLCLAFPSVRQWFDLLDEAFDGTDQPLPSRVIFPAPTGLTDAARQGIDDQLMGMDIGPAAVFVASMALYELLQAFGVSAAAMVGHSSGENTALTASATVAYERRSQLIEKMGQFNQIIQEVEQQDLVRRGTLLAVGGLTIEQVCQLMAPLGDRAHIAMDNCKNQVIVFGDPQDMERLNEQCSQVGGMCLSLPFDRAYHTPHFAEVSQALRKFYNTFTFQSGHTPVYSCASGDCFPSDPDAIRDLAAYQWMAPVQFRQLVQHLYDQGFRQFVEVGPSSNLTAFVTDILRGQQDYVAMASNNRQRPGLEQLQLTLGQLFVGGADLQWQPFFEHRRVTTVDFTAVTPDPAKQSFSFPTVLPVAQLPANVARHCRAQIGQVVLVEGQPPPIPSNPGPEPAIAPRSWPLLGTIVAQTPDYLVSDRVFTLETDRFLRDHVFGGPLSHYQPEFKALPVIPLTFSLEMIAEAANCLTGSGLRVVSLHHLRAYRWLALDRGELILRVEAKPSATVTPQPVVAPFVAIDVRLFQIEPQTQREPILVFEGEVRLQPELPPPPLVSTFGLTQSNPPRLADDDLYRTCMFHGPQLQGVKHLRQWSLDGIEADLAVLPTDKFFQAEGQPQFCLDPGLLDAAGQLVGYWISEQWGPADSYCFPFQIASIYQYADPLPPGSPVLCRSQMQFTGPHQIDANFELVDRANRVIYSIQGWTDICYQVPRNNFYPCRITPATEYLSEPWMQVETGTLCRLVSPFPTDFLDASWGIWKRMLAHLMLSPAEREIWYALPEAGPRRTDWLLGRIAAKDALRQWADQYLGLSLAPVDVEIRTTPTGQPYAHCDLLDQQPLPALSISHSQGYAVAALVPSGQALGVDLERRSPLPDWENLGAAFTAQEQAFLQALGADQGLATLGLWCAKEAAAKATGLGLQGSPTRWEMTQCTSHFDWCWLSHAGQSMAVQLWFTEDDILAICRLESSGRALTWQGEPRATWGQGLA